MTTVSYGSISLKIACITCYAHKEEKRKENVKLDIKHDDGYCPRKHNDCSSVTKVGSSGDGGFRGGNNHEINVLKEIFLGHHS